jgi:signal transduction histidine kinase
VVKELEDRVEARGIDLRLIYRGLTLHGINRDLIFQLIYNLVNNAISITKKEEKYLFGSAYPYKSYTIIIEDTGTGIPQNDLVNIFDRFKKSKIAGEGYGLGLSIVKTIAQYHGISIDVRSVYEKGSAFNIFSADMVSSLRMRNKYFCFCCGWSLA